MVDAGRWGHLPFSVFSQNFFWFADALATGEEDIIQGKGDNSGWE